MFQWKKKKNVNSFHSHDVMKEKKKWKKPDANLMMQIDQKERKLPKCYLNAIFKEKFLNFISKKYSRPIQRISHCHV